MVGEKEFTQEVPFEQITEGLGPVYIESGEPVGITRLLPNSSKHTKVLSLINEDPRSIEGLNEYSSPEDLDMELRQSEDISSEIMSPVIQFAVIGASGVPEKYRGEILGWVELLQENPSYWRKHGFYDFPDETLILAPKYSKKFFNWREDINTPEMVGDLPTQRSSKNRKDLWFARAIGNSKEFDDREVAGVMGSAVKQAMNVVINMEKRISNFETTVDGDSFPKEPRKVVFIASVIEGNIASEKLLEKIGYKKHPKRGEEDGIYYTIWSYEDL